MGFRPPLQNVVYSIARPGRQRGSVGAILALDSFAVRAMSFYNRPVVLIAAIIAAGFCVFLAFQAAALLLPFVLSSSYRWVSVLIAILLMVIGGFRRARRRRRVPLQLH